VNKQAAKNNRVIDCLLQMHIADEATKFGLNEAEVQHLLSTETYTDMQHIRITGLMGMATFTDDKKQVRNEFRQLKYIFNQLKKTFFNEKDSFIVLKTFLWACRAIIKLPLKKAAQWYGSVVYYLGQELDSSVNLSTTL